MIITTDYNEGIPLCGESIYFLSFLQIQLNTQCVQVISMLIGAN